MNAPEQLTPTLTIIEDDGDFTVRVGAQANAKQISQAVVPLLAGLGAKKLLLITPLDTKVFKFNGNGNGKVPYEGAAGGGGSVATPPRRTVMPDDGAPPSPEDASADLEKYLAEQERAERVQAEMDRLVQSDPGLTVEEEQEPQVPVRRQKSTEPKVAAAATACGRCQGEGALPGGGQCPVCRGKGVIGKWGRKR